MEWRRTRSSSWASTSYSAFIWTRNTHAKRLTRHLKKPNAIPPKHAADMEITISKIVAVVIAIGCAIGFVVNMRAAGVVLLLAPLGLIWFPEEIGSYTGYIGDGRTIDTETPPFIV